MLIVSLKKHKETTNRKVVRRFEWQFVVIES